ncbi:MAG: AsmA-like C-terminal region-containing protein [Opitutae bacterium]|nr:AsmA-like C-terminal region-containing protein [Opitutae bacterium]
MSATPHPQIKSPLRYCLSCAATLVCWALWIVLGLGIAGQLYIAAMEEVPVPDFVLRRIEERLAAENLAVRFGRANFDPTGRLRLENVQLFSRSFEEPLLTSRLLSVRKGPWAMLSGRLIPDEIELEGATLQLPAMLSPSGTAEPLLRDVAGHVHYEETYWRIDQLTFRAGPLAATLRGEVQLPRGTGGRPLSVADLVNRYLQSARRIALHLPQLQALEQPQLHLQGNVSAQGRSELAFQLTGAGLRRPLGRPLELGPFEARGVWSEARPHSLALSLRTGGIAWAEFCALQEIRGNLRLGFSSDYLRLLTAEGELAAGQLTVFGEEFDAPVFLGTYRVPEGRAQLAASLRSHGGVLTLRSSLDLPRQAAEVAFDGMVAPALVTGMLTRYGPKLEPYFRFGDPFEAHGTARLAPGWHFDGLNSRVRVDRLDSHGVLVTSARGRIDVDAALNFLAHDALATIGENYGRGSYFMNFRTMDYRFLLAGALRPPVISGWFRSDWWPNFWSNFAFPAAPPLADVDVQGNWHDGARTSYFGSTDAEAPVVLGGDFERARTRIFLRPQFTHVIELTAERAKGTQRAGGWFKRFADEHRATAFEYDLQGNLDPAVTRRVGGPAAEKVLAMLDFARPPQAHVWGRTDFHGEHAVSNVRFDGRGEGGVQFNKFPFDAIHVVGGLSADDLRLDTIEFRLAGGTGTGKASLGNLPGARALGFDLYVKDADLARTIRALEQFEAARSGTKIASMTESKFLQRASGGRLELAVSGLGDPDNLLATLKGSGNAQLTGAELGEIHLFGLLSQVLSAVWLNFSSLKLDTARTSFSLADGRVHFPDLRVNGPSAVIDAKGDYLIATKSLDFTARLKPYEETRNPITAVVGIVINPLTSIFELRLTGPLAKPSWSLSFGAPSLGSSSTPAAPTPPANPVQTAPANNGKK